MNITINKREIKAYQKIHELDQQLKESKAEIEDLYNGRLGACHTCEQVAELNIKLEQQLKEANKVIEYAVIESVMHKCDKDILREYLNKYKVKE